jgi:hypothetical protein
MIRMSIVNSASDQNGYAGMNTSCPIALRPATVTPIHRTPGVLAQPSPST